MLRVLAGECGFQKTRAPPEMTIANFVAQTGGLVGFHPSKRQPLPGTEKLWQGVRKLYDGIFAIQAWENRKMNNQDTELSMLH